MSRRLGIFLFIFILINLLFIPILSLYGLRVCPVLSIPGFGFGCYYSGIYIFIANLLNGILIFVVHSNTKKKGPMLNWIQQNTMVAYAVAYFISTLVALVSLQILLNMNHLSSQSRAPEILGLASLLLGILQAYGLNWALADAAVKEEDNPPPAFGKLWGSHVFRTMFPLIVISSVILHFLISQSISFNEGRTAPVASHDGLIEQTSYVVIFMLAWLLLTFTFHFLSEKDHVIRLQDHLDHLKKLDFKFRSNMHQAWGLWAALLHQLNLFSKILGERNQLLKSFSRFVSAGVAREALKGEIKESNGVVREITIIMSDIRNFTAMAEKLSPQQVVVLLNEYFTAMLDVMTGYQISVDKFIGDGILAYVEPYSEDSTNVNSENRLAVEASLEMLRRLRQLNNKLKKMVLPEIKIGIGVYRGSVVIGLIGSETKLQHTIIGDTVNRSARLEGLCKDLGVAIAISGSVWNSLDKETQSLFGSHGLQTVKGIAEAIEVYGGPI
ncbi:MAG: hypothetical protein B7Y39_11805 [Bdellovibrio sp. 28-41-41]|nr:MAG: hypothetical protein B7Y39_11805 [Bdellovibrio sp. 28-41-41]